MQITVSEFLVRYLERLGVGHIFGMPGAHILPVYDALRDSTVRSVLAKHEQGAAFMAGGYARARGDIGACIATAGPGATNLVTGIANAFADRLPMIVITGETSTHIFGKGGLQESSGEGGAIDQGSLFHGITRYHRLIERTDYLPQVLNQASRALRSAQPGPVLLSVPFNVQQERIDERLLEQTGAAPLASAPEQPELIECLAGRLLAARHPVIVAGHGCIRANAQAELRQLSEQLAIPVCSSLKAKGVIDEESPLSLGSIGVTSSGHAYQRIVEYADLLLILGASFNERTSYLWDQHLLDGKWVAQIDYDGAQLGKVFRPDLAIQGDIRLTLKALLERLTGHHREHTEGAHKGGGADDYRLFQHDFSLVEHFFTRLAGRFPDDLQLFDDNIIFAQNFLRVSSANRYYPNTGISSLGHAIPAAIGARFASERTSFAVLGDGGFQMCALELMTAVNYRIPLNVVLFNNGSMGLIRKNQHQHYRDRFIDCDFINPDFALLARAFGITHYRLENNDQVDELFSRADLCGAINLIEIPIDRDAFPNYRVRR